jgi:hypothetical protein
LSGYDPRRVADDRALRQLAADGLLVAYELAQDGDRAVEVAVGPPLSAAEKRPAAWWPPQRALLGLPSGRLRVEPYDSLRISPDWDLWSREHRERYGTKAPYHGAALRVPRGRYLLTLHRVDWDRLAGEGTADEAAGAGVPSEVLTLSPRTSGRPLGSAVGLLRHPAAAPRSRRTRGRD